MWGRGRSVEDRSLKVPAGSPRPRGLMGQGRAGLCTGGRSVLSLGLAVYDEDGQQGLLGWLSLDQRPCGLRPGLAPWAGAHYSRSLCCAR